MESDKPLLTLGPFTYFEGIILDTPHTCIETLAKPLLNSPGDKYTYLNMYWPENIALYDLALQTQHPSKLRRSLTKLLALEEPHLYKCNSLLKHMVKSFLSQHGYTKERVLIGDIKAGGKTFTVYLSPQAEEPFVAQAPIGSVSRTAATPGALSDSSPQVAIDILQDANGTLYTFNLELY